MDELAEPDERAALRAALAREHERNMLELYHHERRVAQLGATFLLALALLLQILLPAPWRQLTAALCALLALGWMLGRWRCHGCGKLPLLPGSIIHHLDAPFNPPGCPRCGEKFR